jgi:hypothetical protein
VTVYDYQNAIISRRLNIVQNAIELQEYKISYKTISITGILAVTDDNFTTEAKNQNEAIDFTRTKALAEGYSGIRITKVQKLTEPPVQNLKKKKTIWGWVFSLMFVSAMLAKLLPRLLS